MGKCESQIKEIRFVIEDKLTQCYVYVEAFGDCPLNVQGWHHKTIASSTSVVDFLNSKDFLDYLLWPLNSPDI